MTTNLVGILFVMSIFLLSIVFLTLTNYYIKKIRNLSNRGRELFMYGKNIIIGLVSGGTVVVIEKIVDLILKDSLVINHASLTKLFSSIISFLIILFFLASLLIFLVIYLVHEGMRRIIKNSH